jgi:hypothetical protein
MNIQRIEKILERYYNGETSLEEERELRDFFSGEKVPPNLVSIRDQFTIADHSKDGDVLSDDFDEKILSQLQHDNIIHMPRSKRQRIFWMAGIAASILILVGVFFKSNFYTNKIEDTFSDPEIAYHETKKILQFVSSKLNKGTENLDQMNKFDNSLASLKNVDKFETGINEAQKINKVTDYLNVTN